MNKLEKLLVDIIESEVLKDGHYALSSYALYVDTLTIKSHTHVSHETYLIFDDGKLLYASQNTKDIVKFIYKEFNESKPKRFGSRVIIL
ncbi:hypothetical protein [Bacillus wiedmannii]|uniref:hypothetical protein n=1 Tax=Bacillus wiedmannii TaxID=1890302 RepID=UPI000BEFDBF7|nr:hypothetical protein [Bacillus wiedmannii]PEM44857.1 hypothetical protein CN618_28285 [Bacillus wiedmannii]